MSEGESSAESGRDTGISAGDGTYMYDFYGQDDLLQRSSSDLVPAEAVIWGANIQVGMVELSPDAGGESHTHPTEQFTYVHQGTVRSRVEGDEEELSEDSLIYVPHDTEHELEVVGDEAVHLYTVRPNEHSDEERPDSLNEEVESTLLHAGDGDYHFALTEYGKSDSGSAYSVTEGFFIQATQIQVGRMRFPAGHGADPHTHANEQFNLGLGGEAHWVIEDHEITVGSGQVNYIPPDGVHAANASEDGPWDFFAAKDTGYRAFGDPVDE